MRILFRQLLDPVSSTYSYLLADPVSSQAVLIDPVFEQVSRDLAMVEELGLTLLATLDTHAHADHVTGAWLIKARLNTEICIAAAAGAQNMDRALLPGDRIRFGQRFLDVRATPGHTNGCLTYVLDDHSMAFTGDALLIRGCGRTDFQEGNAQTLFRSIHSQIFTLPDECLLYPGHDYRGLTVTTVSEERRYNPRLGGDASEGDFAGYMSNLGLPHPKLIDVAVPANLRCGRPVSVMPPNTEPNWAPLHFTFGGIWEIAPDVLEERLGDVQIVDVRDVNEFKSDLGHIPGSKVIPLSELSARKEELNAALPIVLVCRSGARSALASLMLQKLGFEFVANLSGGLLRWSGKGLPVVDGME